MVTLSEIRRHYKPKVPKLLEELGCVVFEEEKRLQVDPAVALSFLQTSTLVPLRGKQGTLSSLPKTKIGVVFSGGPAPGGHNVVAGLFDAVRKEGLVVGFVGGPAAIISGEHKELKAAEINHFRNQGGFDLLGSGRTKIETSAQFRAILEVATKLKLDGLVIVGGDDSNTNAALLAEYFLKEGSSISVIGVPKTIDGDIQNPYVPISFGFDTAAAVYSELIGNLARDTLSSLKYFHFVKLMGRSASHLTLECALRVRPNVTLISEEKKGLKTMVKELADWVEIRQKTPCGIVLIPEGLFEETLASTLEKDSHGNVHLSGLATEQLLIDEVQKELQARHFKGKFEPIGHFYGYEGRCGYPSNFDANYSYALGIVAALLVMHKRTGLMAYVNRLHLAPSEWTFGGVPLPPLLKMRERNGALKPVIDKALVDLQGRSYQALQKHRAAWLHHIDYAQPGPLQFTEDSAPLILQ